MSHGITRCHTRDYASHQAAAAAVALVDVVGTGYDDLTVTNISEAAKDDEPLYLKIGVSPGHAFLNSQHPSTRAVKARHPRSRQAA